MQDAQRPDPFANRQIDQSYAGRSMDVRIIFWQGGCCQVAMFPQFYRAIAGMTMRTSWRGLYPSPAAAALRPAGCPPAEPDSAAAAGLQMLTRIVLTRPST